MGDAIVTGFFLSFLQTHLLMLFDTFLSIVTVAMTICFRMFTRTYVMQEI
jgi:hypothetical protein